MIPKHGGQDRAEAPGKGAWDCAWSSVKPLPTHEDVALAINPTHGRSQHQARCSACKQPASRSWGLLRYLNSWPYAVHALDSLGAAQATS